MKLRLNDLALVPPPPIDGFKDASGKEVTRHGHWWFYSEESDTWVFGGCYSDLVEHLREHLITNKLPVPADLDGAVQEFICSNTPGNWKNGCVAVDERGFSLTVTLALVKRWLLTMAAYSKDGELVSQEEAERRANICLACHYRTPITGCKGCGQSLGGMMTKLLINRATDRDEQLTACGVCGCAQKAMIWFPNETLDKGSAGLSYPSDTGGRDAEGQPVPCWRIEKALPDL